MNALLQTVAITAMNLRNIPQRIGSSLVVCIGVGGVVAVLVTVLAMATGLEAVITQAAQPDRAMVLRRGALAEVLSTVSRDELAVIESAPGVRRGADGVPLVSPEVLLSVNLPRRRADGVVRQRTHVGRTRGAPGNRAARRADVRIGHE